MSAADNLQSEDPFQCSVCLGVFKDPVTIPCGHTFCSSCITTHWDGKDVNHCPLCQDTFGVRPELKVNITIREALKSEMKAREIRSDSSASALTESRIFAPVMAIVVVVGLMCLGYVGNLQTLPDQTFPTHLGEWGKEKLKKVKEEMKEEIQELLRSLRDIKTSAELSKKNTLSERSISLQFNRDFRSVLKKGLVELDQMEKQQKAAETMTEEHIKELEQDITDLQKKSDGIDRLSPTEDYQHLFQLLNSESLPSKDWFEISFYRHLSFVGPVKNFCSGLIEELQRQNEEVELGELQKYHVNVTLDPYTAHPGLILSEDGKQVSEGITHNNHHDNLRWFDTSCVLSREGFSSGRFYYEVQVKDKTHWTLGVARKSIIRKGEIGLSQVNENWIMWLRGEKNEDLVIPSARRSLSAPPQKVGVFVDYEEGQVSFYDVDNRSHIYSFTDQNFTETLYPLFSPTTTEWLMFMIEDGENSAPLVITPVSHLD